MTGVIARVLLRMLSWLPPGGPSWLARRLAGTWMRLSPTKRRTTIRNLERCYPNLDAQARERLMRESFVHYLASVLESGHHWYLPPARNLSRCIETQGRELLDEAVRTGRGTLVLVPHFGAWEYLGVYLPQVEEFGSLYKRPADPRLDELLRELRQRAGLTMFAADTQGLRRLFTHLSRGKGVAVLPDQDPSGGEGRFADFFGLPAYTGILAPRIAHRTGCAVLFGACERVKGGRYRAHFLPADAAIGGEDLDAALAAVNRGVERCIAIDPAQYLWSYRRFKTQPEGHPPFYH